MKETICTVLGAIGAAIASLFGGWDTALVTLLICMAVDYGTGLIVAGVFHASPKSDGGALESRAGFKGLCRKGVAIAIVMVVCRLDMLLGVSYIRDMVIIGFIVNELLSIVENAGLMGLPLPDGITKAIDVLKKKADGDGEDDT